MSRSKIEWLARPGTIPETWNPVIGCSPVSEGCENCYAMRMAWRLAHNPRTARTYLSVVKYRSWSGTIKMRGEELLRPASWRKWRTVFVCSMGDLWHPLVEREFRWAVLDVASGFRKHTYIFLTKRAKEMAKDVQAWAKGRGIADNLWFGVSVENQRRAEERIPWLLQIPATVRFVSVEPMLGPVNLKRAIPIGKKLVCAPDVDGGESGVVKNRTRGSSGIYCPDCRVGVLDWVICGGGTEPIHPDWVRLLRDQCVTASVPFLFKQWGKWMPCERYLADWRSCWLCRRHNKPHLCVPPMMRVGRKRAGRLLDGREWNEWPNPING